MGWPPISILGRRVSDKVALCQSEAGFQAGLDIFSSLEYLKRRRAKRDRVDGVPANLNAGRHPRAPEELPARYCGPRKGAGLPQFIEREFREFLRACPSIVEVALHPPDTVALLHPRYRLGPRGG